ncbi:MULTISPECIES: hypothetical protein [Pseudomonas syringae group]|uniref:hypothetical protein n=2 Tax=Pseudomonas syringae group TaxID=136849 RepID=UPI0002A79662|nr:MULTISPECIES: hypothetical protein [Pseudomonas syringae group]ELQ09048.1 hypothetical protein A988_19381 [Pseudomonas syringae BRIP39023]MCK9706358.1 hypothetical protein [Pseudomonas syringae pv. syringae]MCK9712336.1 hypothetical protein [Pseudomonas syringae pv. syringae]MCK9777039.1 hypothetical protein [Pseudomonas syringae pv. syringae]MDU8630187.1 hypothetical protein [Pseudomonas syringae group sp. 243L2]
MHELLRVESKERFTRKLPAYVARLEEQRMDDDLEAEVWRAAADFHGPALELILREVLSSYQRKPGFDPQTRLYEKAIGVAAFKALRTVIDREHFNPSTTGYPMIRERLRFHLRNELLRHLMQQGHASPIQQDTLIAVDLGI